MHCQLAPETRALDIPDASDLRDRIARLLDQQAVRYERLWAYYRNPLRIVGTDTADASDRPYRQAQEWGMPTRITGMRSTTQGSQPITGVARKEVVIENDIGWRVETMVDFLFGKPVIINSAADDPARRPIIAELLRLIIAQNGGIALLQQMSLIGAVYGFVDVLVKLDTSALEQYRARIDADAAACGIQQLGQPCVQDHDSHQDEAGSSEQRVVGVSMVATSDDTAAADAGPVLVHDDLPREDPDAAQSVSRDALTCIARLIRLEIVEPARALPVLAGANCQELQAYAQVYRIPRSASARRHPRRPVYKTSWIQRMKRSAGGMLGARDPVEPLNGFAAHEEQDEQTLVCELLTPDRWDRYEDEQLTSEGENSLGQIPLVHVQNVTVPFEYAGLSEVEPLMPLQDELNTRLSDRAYRIALQSFKMYLGKGIENFLSMPVSPGQMWMTSNEQASIDEFGGDASAPSEDAHIADIREALDKTSGVSPVAAGAIKGRIGRLTSAAALRVTMQALLAKTERKRTTYGVAIGRICELALLWLDKADVFHTTPDQRRVELHWPSPLPVNELELLEQAEAKVRLGVPQEQVLRELGY